MANPQPDRFIKFSRELVRALTGNRISGVENQVLLAIIYLTYGAIPSVKEAQISNADIRKLTGLSGVAVSKALKKLIDANRITKNGNYNPPKYGIQKDYEKWKVLPKKVRCSNDRGSRKSPINELPKLVTNVTKIGNKPKVTPIIEKKEKEKIECIYNFYISQIQPRQKSPTRAKKNIAHHLKNHPPEKLRQAILNYKKTIDFDSSPNYRKYPANFFGRAGENKEFFIDYFPENFDSGDDTNADPAMRIQTQQELEAERYVN